MIDVSGWRLALRIARRTLRRNVGRSLLVATLVGVPVAGATLADVLYQTTSNDERQTYEAIGDADALIDIAPVAALPVDFRPDSQRAWGWDENEEARDASAVDLPAHLPDGTTVAPVSMGFDVRLADGDRIVRTSVFVSALGDPLTTHEARLDTGRLPEAGDEVLLTRTLAGRLGVLDGDNVAPDAQITVDEGATLAVTGIAVQPFCLDCEAVLALPDSLAASIEDLSDYRVSYLADLPAGTDVDALWPELARDGIAMIPRVAFIDPDRYRAAASLGPISLAQLQGMAMAALVVGLGILTVVLLAGAAFAVGAKRQTRDLGLITVAGGAAKHVRRTVLAQGMLLGVLGAGAGVAVGWLVAVGGRPLWQRMTNELIEGWRFGAAELAIAAGVGAFAGLAAAVVPAIGAARMNPVDALAGRFRSNSLRSRLPILGIVVIAAGALIAFAGNRMIASEFAAYAEALRAVEGTGASVDVTEPSAELPVLFQLAGLTIAVAGLVMVMPGLVTYVARLGRRLSLAPRYAVRDAARHRHRTAPAVAAIMIVVTGAVGVAFAIGGLQRAEEFTRIQSYPDDVISVQSSEDDTAQAVREAAEAAAGRLPNAAVHDVVVPSVHTSTLELDDDAFGGEGPEYLDLSLELPQSFLDDCPLNCEYPTGGWQPAIAAPELIEMTTGLPLDAAANAALEAGKVVVFDPAYLGDDGSVMLSDTFTDPLKLPGYVVDRPTPYFAMPGAFVSAETAAAHGWAQRTTRALVTYEAASADEVDAALDAIEDQGAFGNVDRTTDPYRGVYLVLVAGSAFVTLVGVAISVALAAAEGRADLATLAAVGAPPRRRRVIAGAQALVVGGLGTVLGVGLATYIAYTAWPTTGSPDFIVPWSSIALVGLAVPLLAVVASIVFTPGRLPMIRRLE